MFVVEVLLLLTQRAVQYWLHKESKFPSIALLGVSEEHEKFVKLIDMTQFTLSPSSVELAVVKEGESVNVVVL